jgi:hypothetical protein
LATNKDLNHLLFRIAVLGFYTITPDNYSHAPQLLAGVVGQSSTKNYLCLGLADSGKAPFQLAEIHLGIR